MENFFVINLETGKLELHFDKDMYADLSEDAKKEIKSNFLWSRRGNCWVSRCKNPNLTWARKCAESIGLYNAGTTGEKLSFAEQMERKAEKAERRAERYEEHAEHAAERGESLQKPIRDMHGDIAFFTQPNINTSAGRAFTNRRNRMFASFERGFEEFKKSEYWTHRANTARHTAEQTELKDKAFIVRRISERESYIRKIEKNIKELESYIPFIERGETPKDKHGWEVNITRDEIDRQLEHWLDRLETRLDELGYYQEALENIGGVEFSKDNIKVGYIVNVKRWGRAEIMSTGPKNCIVSFGNGSIKIQYAEILEVLEECERTEKHPFKVGDSYTCNVWNGDKYIKVSYTIVKASEKSVTLQADNGGKIVRKPGKSHYRNEWYISITNSNNGTWYKEPTKAQEPEEMSPEDFETYVNNL